MKAQYIAVMVSLALVNLALGQCVVCLEDNTCSGQTCPDDASCSSTTFTVPASGTYCLVVKTICEGNYECADCWGCAEIFKQTGHISMVNVHTINCGMGSCMDLSCSASLLSGTTYELWVCKGACGDSHADCEDCPEDCKAKTCVYLASGFGCAP